jgi:hypothetical protein
MKLSLPWDEIGHVPECRIFHLVASFVMSVAVFVKTTHFVTTTQCYGRIAAAVIHLTGLVA